MDKIQLFKKKINETQMKIIVVILTKIVTVTVMTVVDMNAGPQPELEAGCPLASVQASCSNAILHDCATSKDLCITFKKQTPMVLNIIKLAIKILDNTRSTINSTYLYQQLENDTV